jgi:hypothetical protein
VIDETTPETGAVIVTLDAVAVPAPRESKTRITAKVAPAATVCDGRTETLTTWPSTGAGTAICRAVKITDPSETRFALERR